MELSRREFVKTVCCSALASLGALSTWTRRVFADGSGLKGLSRLRVRAGENIFMAFNNIKDAEAGESDEFTSMRNIQKILSEMQVPQGTTVIGIGARTGSPEAPYALPGEMGYLWRTGDAWRGKVTSHIDARPVPLNLDDPIVVTQVGVLHESTAHHFELNSPEREGTVLWSLYNDDTGSPALGYGMHNLFDDVDGGLLSQIYKSSRKALKNPQSWATPKERAKLQRFMPNLKDDRVWSNFSQTLAKPVVHSEWLPYVRSQGWPGAAVVLRGSMENVTQFHLLEWVRKSPKEPEFEIGKGTHTLLKIRAGREARPFITVDDAEWTMVGFIWDLGSEMSSPSMPTYQNFSDIFGQDFHIHGFRDDGKVGGHTLCALLGSGKLSVSLYPLTFDENESAFLFNNDLRIVKDSIAQFDGGLVVRVANVGRNFVRNVSVQLSKRRLLGSLGAAENLVIPLLRPGEEKLVRFTGKTARDRQARRCLWIDRNGHFIEGEEAEKNNKVYF
jgi:hypothetical protein